MFFNWYQVFTAKGLECALDLLEKKEVIASDLLHLLKNACARIINRHVTMNLEKLFVQCLRYKCYTKSWKRSNIHHINN